MDDMTYEIDDKLVACPKCGGERSLDGENPCDRCWGTGQVRQHTLAIERLQARAELFEALLREALGFIDAYLVEQGDYSSIRLEESAAKLFGEIKRALAPDADRAALLEEVQGDE